MMILRCVCTKQDRLKIKEAKTDRTVNMKRQIKKLWLDQHKPRTRKITYHLVGQNQSFSLTMKNGIIIFILIVSSPAIFPIPTSIFHMTFSLDFSHMTFLVFITLSLQNAFAYF